VDPSQRNFDFSRQIFEKFRFFQANFRKISIFLKQIFEKLRFFEADFKEISTFQANSKKFDFCKQIFEKIRFFRQLLETFRFSRQKLLIYSYRYFWTNYSASLQRSPLSNILPVHDKI